MNKQNINLIFAVVFSIFTIPTTSTGSFDYESCKNSTCFAVPQSCIQIQNCTAAIRTCRDKDRFAFEIFTNIPDVAYISFGISQTPRMESTLVLESVIFEGIQSEYASLNVPLVRSNVREGTVRMLKFQNKIFILLTDFIFDSLRIFSL